MAHNGSSTCYLNAGQKEGFDLERAIIKETVYRTVYDIGETVCRTLDKLFIMFSLPEDKCRMSVKL